jgi:HlyD family secretion protein
MKFSGSGIIIGIGVLLAAFFYFIVIAGKNTDEYTYFEVQRGDFEMVVIVTGELGAETSMPILGPSALQSRNIRLENVMIKDLIPEGTIVEEGDWVATLDRTEAELSLSSLEERMLTEASRYNSAILDTSITMSNLRNDLINLEHSLEELSLILEQSVYEPPATIRQAEINLERAKQNLELSRSNYKLRERDAIETVREAELEFERRTRHYHALRDVIEQFEITAPAPGMVIYHRLWHGTKRRVGSTINSRDLTVAVIPNLNSLVSRTYVNEIDVNKVTMGQPVRIGIDAFSDMELSGRVVEVSNIGQELPNTNARVFEVTIRIDQVDDNLRPAMTTSNAIITGKYSDVFYVPLAAVHDPGGIPYVYKSDGTRQVVVTGDFNHNYIIIENGLQEGDLVHLEIPQNGKDFKLVGNEMIAGQ